MAFLAIDATPPRGMEDQDRRRKSSGGDLLKKLFEDPSLVNVTMAIASCSPVSYALIS